MVAVPPYSSPMDVVAETTPLLACSGPLRVPIVKPPLNVFVFVNIFAVYVFGMVVEEWMKEFIPEFRKVESNVSEPPEFVSPEPSSDVNELPPIIKFVVDAVVNDPYVVDE